MKNNEIEVVKDCENPKILIVTPLLPDHKISRITKKTIKRNSAPFMWISSKGLNNIPTNAQIGLEWYRKNRGNPLFFLMLDNDIELGRNMIDRMMSTLENSSPNIAFTYVNFEFKGHINRKFPADAYDINRLLQDNYISSNSMIKTKCLDSIGGMVINDRYKRLLDWCLWLKFFYHGFHGIPTQNANFVAESSKNDISAGSVEDFRTKKIRVIDDFIRPIIDKYSE